MPRKPAAPKRFKGIETKGDKKQITSAAAIKRMEKLIAIAKDTGQINAAITGMKEIFKLADSYDDRQETKEVVINLIPFQTDKNDFEKMLDNENDN